MKKYLSISVLSLLCTLPTSAQLTGTGFYRFRNAQNTNHYISLANDKFSYQFLFGSNNDANFGNKPQIGGGLSNLSDHTTTVKNVVFQGAETFMKNDIHLVEDPDYVDPSTILYLAENNSQYNIISQGTSLLTLTTGSYKASVELIFNNIYASISRSSGTGANSLYTAAINIAASDVENISYNDFLFALGKSSFMSQAKLGSYYFYDNNGTFGIVNSTSAQNTKWYIEPVTSFNVKPEVSYGGKFYTTLYVPFAYTLGNNVLKAYTVTSVDADGNVQIEEIAASGGKVPAGTPVILECTSSNAADCKLNIVKAESPIFTAAVAKVQYAPAQSTATNYTGTNILKGDYFKNEDAAFSYQYNRSGSNSSSTLNLQNYTAPTASMYVLGITASGKMGLVKATGTAMPANKAWLEYTGTAELVLPFSASKPGDVNRDGNVTIADVTALVDIILGKDPGPNYTYDHEAANVNGDSDITIADVTALVDIILGK